MNAGKRQWRSRFTGCRSALTGGDGRRRQTALAATLAVFLFAACHPSAPLPPATDSGAVSTEGRLPKGALAFGGGPTLRVEIATSAEEIQTGLSYRDSLCEDCGLYFVFSEERVHRFWMRQMRFPIDIVWIKAGRVVGVEHDLPPPAPGTSEAALPRYPSPVPLRHVLEVPAGFAKEHGIEVGRRVEVVLER